MLVVGMSVSLAFGLIGSAGDGPLARFDHLWLDAYLRATANGKVATSSVVIDVDDVSLDAVGQWPWPRYRIAALVKAIAQEEPAAIGLDVVFPEPDQTSLDNVQRSFKRDFGVDLAFSGVPAGLTDNDGFLGTVLGRMGVVGARYFYFDHVSQTAAPPAPAFRILGPTNQLRLDDAPGVMTNNERIEAQIRYTGHINTQTDGDGILRRSPLLIQHRGQIYPHLTLATFMRAQGIDSATVVPGALGPSLRVGDRVIPIDERGYAVPRMNGPPGLYPAISAVDLLNGTARTEGIKGKMVFVGSSAAALNDFHQTIFDTQFPGLKMLAVLGENMAEGDFVREPQWGGVAVFTACLLSGLILALRFMVHASPLRLGVEAMVFLMAVTGASIAAMASLGVFVSPVAVVLLTVCLVLFYAFAGYAVEEREAYLSFKRIANARQVTLESMAAVAETRDPETGGHIKRTQGYVQIIARRLKDDGHFSDVLTDEYLNLLVASAPLHDIGKVGVPDRILTKPGKLTDDEFAVMKRHTEYGRDIVLHSAQHLEGDNFLLLAGEVAISHHEKWDGSGYPQGLSGSAIPLSGRIMAVADVYDALISNRCYKSGMTHEQAEAILVDGRGKHFDPLVLEAFVVEKEAVKAIAERYRDGGEAQRTAV